MKGKPTRELIVHAADQLFYVQGYGATSFADIASAVKISRGNFYYHFRTKDEILDAVISLRLSSTQDMLEGWEATSDAPQDRIKSFIRILIMNQSKIMLHGCPVGTLYSELAKLDHAAQTDAAKLFSLFRQWLSHQFTLMGQGERADAYALHLLARSQGVATLANAFHDKCFVAHEVRQMCDWLDSLRAGSAQLS